MTETYCTDLTYKDLMIDYLSHVDKKPFHILFLSIGCVLMLVACIGAFKMHKSYTYQMSEEQKKLLKIYAIAVAIVSGGSFLSILYILYEFRKKNGDYIYICNVFFDNTKISVLVVFVFLVTLGISSYVLSDRNYSTFLSLAENIPSTREANQKLFRYVLVSPAVLLVLAVIYLILYGSYVISSDKRDWDEDV